MIRTIAAAAALIASLGALHAQEAGVLNDVPLDCTASPGGAQCQVEHDAEDVLLYCVAFDAQGDPVANTTVSSGDGLTVFNGVRVDEIDALRCRVE